MKKSPSLTVTMQAVAQDAGVSRATASRVFSHPELVDERTQSKVLESARKLGYVRNEAATQLARKSSDMIGLLLRDAQNPAYGYLHDAILAESFHRNLFVATMSAGDYHKDSGEILRMSRLMQFRPAGMYVASGLISSEDLRPFAAQVPSIVLARCVDVEGLHAVGYDELAHAHMIADAVIKAGHTRIAVCVTDRFRSQTEHLRTITMIERLQKYGADVYRLENQNVLDDLDLLLPTVSELMAAHKITAVMFANDVRALKFMVKAKKIGLRIPEDIGVTGCDGVGLASEIAGLLTVKVPVERVCAVAAEHMRSFVVERATASEPIHEFFAGEVVGGATV